MNEHVNLSGSKSVLRRRLLQQRARIEELEAACEAALAQIAGDGWDLNYGQHEDNPLPTQLRNALDKAPSAKS
jgi:uncharacterized protein YdeI (YjbR/CyaY-like superfamily)